VAISTLSGFASTRSRMADRHPGVDPDRTPEGGREVPETASDGIGATDPGMTRVGMVGGIPAVLRDLGFGPDELITSAGIDPRVFDDAGNVVPLAALGRLLNLCVARTGCAHFGLLVGARASASSFGGVGLLMQHSPTVIAALKGFVEHGYLYDRAAAANLEVGDDIAALSYATQSAGIAGADQIAEGEIAAAVRIMKGLCGPTWRPTEVLLPRASPIDAAPFHRFFESPVHFGQEEAAIVFEARWLDHRVPGADAALHDLAEHHLEELVQADDEAFGNQLRRALRRTLLRRNSSADRVASLFAVHRRTMSRRLKVDGLSFKQLVNEVRYDVARQMIGRADMPLAEVAAALGYSEPSALTRAFRRWSGQNPAAWRLANAAQS
jgi:AraC-like DNA-binding protein